MDFESSLAFCQAQARLHDHDRYLSALFAPEADRGGLMTLYAFDGELARVPFLVSDPMLGEIRYQWWRDQLARCGDGEAPPTEVGPALITLLENGRVGVDDLTVLIDAHSALLAEETVEDWGDFDSRIGAAWGQIMRLAAAVLGGGPADATTIAAGLSWGYVQHMRKLPIYGAAGYCPLPLQAMREADFDPHDLLNGRATTGLTALYAILSHRARAHLKVARAGWRKGESDALPAFLPLSLAERYLDLMSPKGFDPFKEPVELPVFRRQPRLLWQALRGRF